MEHGDYLDILRQIGAIREGHFIGTSGRHLPAYINKDKLYQFPEHLDNFAQGLTERILDHSINTELVLAPAYGAIGLGLLVSLQLGQHRQTEVEFAFTSGDLELRPTFLDLISRKRVLIVDDVLTTGQTIQTLAEKVEAKGGNVVGAAVLVKRSSEKQPPKLKINPLIALLEIGMKDWSKEECPLCQAGVSIQTDLGHGAKAARNPIGL